jgi:hypothetical protein
MSGTISGTFTGEVDDDGKLTLTGTGTYTDNSQPEPPDPPDPPDPEPGPDGDDYLTDAKGHNYPASAPVIALGAIAPDATFGGAIRRVTQGKGADCDLYSFNGNWSCDGKHLIVKPNILDAATGKTVISNMPRGGRSFDAQFSPTNPNVYHFFDGKNLKAYDIAAKKLSTVKTFQSNLDSLGGSVDYCDNQERFVLSVGGRVTCFDKKSGTLYTGGPSVGAGSGWIGITPSGNHVIVADSWDFKSYKVDHQAHSVASTGVCFWTLCGTHADLMTGSDGKDYAVARNCWDQPEIYRVDVTLPQKSAENGGLEQQKRQNKKLLTISWDDDVHLSCVPDGDLKDWFAICTETQGKPPVYRNELLLINTSSGEIRRYAFHLSDIAADYYNQPRVSISKSGKVAFASSMGGSHYPFPSKGADIFVLEPEW